SAGIAVGMATNIPPHNLSEVIDALQYLIEHPEASVEKLMQFIKGPDFPTGGIILDSGNIAKAYRTGRGIIKVRGRVYIEKMEKGRNQIVINEVPYQQNKARLVEKIADLVKKKKTEGIVDLRDESDRSGIRVVIEVRRDYDPQVIINQLYQYTPLQQSFGIIMLALVDGEPKVLSLKEILEFYLEHQQEVIRRRSQYDLQRAEDRLHIVEGLRIALSHLDEVILLIRRSPDVPTARTGLMTMLEITEKQAQAILDMRLHRLTGLEISKLEAEYRELLERITYLKQVLADPRLILQIIRDELQQIKERYADQRRTQIMRDNEELSEMDLIFEEDVVITITDRGYIKRLPLTTYRSQRRGGKGVIGMQPLADDRVEQIYITSTHHRLLCFSNMGKVYMLQAHEVPESSRQSRGTPLVNILPLEKNEFITAMLPIYRFEQKLSLLMVTSRGVVKKTLLKEYRNTRKTGIIALTLDEGDELIAVQLTDGHREVLIGASNGLFIRFNENEVRRMGRTARGVRGINLGKGAKVVGADLIADHQEVFMVTEQGYGKRVLAKEFTAQHRGGKGVIGIKVSNTSGPLIGFLIPREEQEEVILITARGQVIRHKKSEVSVLGRYSRGVTLMDVEQGDKVVNFSGVE
ncbi:MAG TPA: DNA gyrase subunit A, partial [Firmicutes bacterium]|nr:DNA gyrase subunit A [Bacillota bacterium]